MSRAPLFLALAVSVATSAGELHSSEILPVLKAKEVLKQCSRSTVDGVLAYWLPTQADVLELEKRLPSYLEREPSGKQALPLSKSGGQYVGVILEGKRFIYGNFYPASMPLQKKSEDPVVVCDGGPAFWGVLYSVESKGFQGLHFNGGW